jgi:hypothetical protein
MKITALEESADFATLDTAKLFSKLKSHELSRKDHPNHDTSLTSKALITSAHVGGYDANPTNTTISSALEFALSSLVAASNEHEGPEKATRGGGVNGSQSKFLIGTWRISRNRPDAPLF